MPNLTYTWHSQNQFPHCKMGPTLVPPEAVGPVEPVMKQHLDAIEQSHPCMGVMGVLATF